jgi:Na+-translocating ferredoxin:NAD+ oxidoreductase RnfC subunit
VVKKGDHVARGDVVGEMPAGAVGARVHASITGVVSDISVEAVVIEAN